MKRFGLIGHPIGHSLSPALFKAGYDGRYPYELIETEDFEEAYARFLEGYDGINVTAPFKELAFAKAEILTDECKSIRATNLLVKTPEGIKAYNSDYLGVRMWLKEVADVLSGCSAIEKRATPLAAGGGARDAVVGGVLFDAGHSERAVHNICERLSVLIVGLGGAGKAAAEAARSLGMEITLMNRTVYNEEIRSLQDFREHFREADIIIYNIPTAIPQLTELTDSDFAPGRKKFILEANYKNPSFNKELIDRMKSANPQAVYTGGKTWLLYQAVTGYELFTEEKPDLAMMSDVL